MRAMRAMYGSHLPYLVATLARFGSQACHACHIWVADLASRARDCTSRPVAPAIFGSHLPYEECGEHDGAVGRGGCWRRRDQDAEPRGGGWALCGQANADSCQGCRCGQANADSCQGWGVGSVWGAGLGALSDMHRDDRSRDRLRCPAAPAILGRGPRRACHIRKAAARRARSRRPRGGYVTATYYSYHASPPELLWYVLPHLLYLPYLLCLLWPVQMADCAHVRRQVR